MNLIERYVTEVGKHLPRKNRHDIQAELRSTLEDMLEDRSQQAGRPADQAMTEELLQEYGAPKDVAASYQTHPYLIGPRLFNIYTLVLKIVIFAVTLGLTIATIVSLLNSSLTPPELLKTLGSFIAGLISALVAAFGNVTLIFAIIERAVPAKEFEEEKEDWTPAELTKEPDPNRVSMGEMIASIVFTAAALIVLNYYPEIIGIWNNTNGEWSQILGLSDAFFRYLPWINMSALLTIALNIWLIRQGVWDALTRWANIGLQIISIGIAVAMLRGPSLLTFSPGSIDPEAASALAGIFSKIIPIALLSVIIISTIEIVKTAVKMLWPEKKSFI
ncbi:MAG: hypothetical protein Kow002_21090 [Anaerolineales bacterium]